MHYIFWRTREYQLLLLVILINLIAGCNDDNTSQRPLTIAQYDTADLNFTSDKSYSALTPWFNPFTQVNIQLVLTSPSGRKLTVPGFFDGDGKGGPHGRNFKVRVSPDETGLWNWQLHSNLVELNNIQGEFNVTGSLQGTFSRGPISVSDKNSKRFAYADQTPIFLLGKFLDKDQPLFLRFSHTLFSENWTNRQKNQLIKHQLSLGINKINIYIANKGDYKSIATTPWLGTASYNLKSRFDLQRWHEYENWISRLRDEGIVAHLWLFADDSKFGNLTDAERELLVRYSMARLSGYVNTVFTLALEWQESFSEKEMRATGILAQNNNPWDRLISVHGIPVTANIAESSTFFNEDWLDFIEIQTGFIDHYGINNLGLLYGNQQDKPVILEEFSFGYNNDEERIKTWAALLTSPGGIGTGSGLNAITQFLKTVDITKYQPVTNLINTNNAYTASSHDGHAIVYIYRNGPVLFNKSSDDNYKGQWFDPRNGDYTGLPFIIDTDKPLTTPTKEDWVLVLKP